jgi:hypothetical protein
MKTYTGMDEVMEGRANLRFWDFQNSHIAKNCTARPNDHLNEM